MVGVIKFVLIKIIVKTYNNAVCVHVYVCMCVCVCVYIYILFSKTKNKKVTLSTQLLFILMDKNFEEKNYRYIMDYLLLRSVITSYW